MVRYENECIQCGKPCIGHACRYYRVPHYYCDMCGEETDPYELKSGTIAGCEYEDLCEDCYELTEEYEEENEDVDQ